MAYDWDMLNKFDEIVEQLRISTPEAVAFSIDATGFLCVNVPLERMTVPEINGWAKEFNRLTADTYGM